MSGKRRGALCFLVAALLLAGGAVEVLAQAREPRAIAENRALDAQLEAAAEALDAERVANLFWKGPEATIVFTDGSVHQGWENLRRFYTEFFPTLASVAVEYSDVSYHQVGDAVIGTGTVKVQAEPKDGPPLDFSYRFTSLRRRQAGKWVFVMRQAQMLPPPPLTASDPLYKRLGGYDAIAAVVDDFIPRLANDAQLGRFFTGMSADSGKRVRQLIVDQVCAATGGPCLYVGRDMKTAHAGLGITEADWDIAVRHLVTTLDKFRVPAREKNEVLGALGGMKDQIVEK